MEKCIIPWRAIFFSSHFENLLNQPGTDTAITYTPRNEVYIPVLDDPFTPDEIANSIRKLKMNKSAGIDGIPPGILKALPEEWIILMTHIFNCVFTSGYPLYWTLTKIFTIFKKGARDDPQNYRGISVLSCIPKLYDLTLSRRFSLWYTPKSEQAGAQAKRGCEEQILTIRLLIDIARKLRKTLYITFVDYQKAYDRVNRHKLLQHLDNLGCGTRFLKALEQSMTTTGVIGSGSFATSSGVKQGSSSSCKLFTAYIDPTISAVNLSDRMTG